MRIILSDAWRQHVLPRLTFFHFAALLLLTASALANFRYGLELGSDNLEKGIAATAALGADFYNALGLLLCAWAYSTKRWAQLAAGAFVLACTVLFSLNAGVGFAASTKDAWIAERTHQATAETDRAGAKKRVEDKLAALAPARSTLEIKPEIDAILSDKRAEGCVELNGSYTKKHCPKVFKLRAELGRAETRDNLTSELNKLLVTTTVDSATNDAANNKPAFGEVDPAAVTIVTFLAKIGITLEPEHVRPWQTLLFVVIMVVGGPVALWLGEGYVQDSRKPVQRETKPAAGIRPQKETESVESVFATLCEKAPVAAKPAKQKDTGKLPPIASQTLNKIKAAGGELRESSQNAMAKHLHMSRTSLRRAADILERSGSVVVDDRVGYALSLAR